MTSRRKFLKQGAFGALATGITLGIGEKVAGRTAWSASEGMLGLNRAAFASQLHTKFVIKNGTRKVELELVEVANLGSKRRAPDYREAFALVLRGNDETPLGQDTYAIEHDKLGAFSFLMVPIGLRKKNSQYYEININRLHG